jgi:integrase
VIDGVHFVASRRPGKPVRWYVYAWRGGPCILKVESPTKPKLGRDELAKLTQVMADAKTVKADTVAGVVRAWRGNPARPESASPEWRALAEGTRNLWTRALDLIEDRWGDLPIALFDDPRMVAQVVKWRDERASTPRAADVGVTVLGQLLEWARLRAWVKINVAAGIPQLYRSATRAEIVWTDDEIERLALAAIALNRPHVIDGLWLGALTGMRRADAVGLTWAEVGEHAIVRVAGKKSRGRRRRAVIPLIPETEQLLAELRTRHRAEGVDTVLVNSWGRPWTPTSFTQAFNAARDLAGIAQPADLRLERPTRAKHFHDLRGTFVTRLCRCGLTDREIADIAAWDVDSVSTIRRTYVDDAAVVVALSQRIRKERI